MGLLRLFAFPKLAISEGSHKQTIFGQYLPVFDCKFGAPAYSSNKGDAFEFIARRQLPESRFYFRNGRIRLLYPKNGQSISYLLLSHLPDRPALVPSFPFYNRFGLSEAFRQILPYNPEQILLALCHVEQDGNRVLL